MLGYRFIRVQPVIIVSSLETMLLWIPINKMHLTGIRKTFILQAASPLQSTTPITEIRFL